MSETRSTYVTCDKKFSIVRKVNSPVLHVRKKICEKLQIVLPVHNTLIKSGYLGKDSVAVVLASQHQSVFRNIQND